MPTRKPRSAITLGRKKSELQASMQGTLRSEKLRSHLLDRIATYQIGDKLPGERALAEECGLSLLTVNKVLSVLAAEGVVERRKGLGTYVRGKSPQSGKAKQSQLQILRFVVRDPETLLRSGGYTSQFYKGLREAAAADGIETLPTPFEIGAQDQESIPSHAFNSDCIVGLVFVEQDVPDYRRLWSLLAEDKRIVAFDYAAPASGLNSVLFDNAGGIRLAVEHCVKNGHNRIAYVGPEGNVGMPGDERLNGFRAALEEFALDPISTAIQIQPHGDTAPIRTLLSSDHRPTAIVSFMDHYLVPVAKVASELGLRIPQDLSLVGFGDGLRREPYPPFSVDSIAFDEIAMGRTSYALWKSGARGLVKRQAGKLHVRGSVAPIAK